jgi:hypothetical protein
VRRDYFEGRHFEQEAPQRPDVCLPVVGLALDHFWTHGARRSHECDCLFERVLELLGRAERTDLEVALVVEVDVARRQHPVHDMPSVDVLQTHQQLHRPC